MSDPGHSTRREALTVKAVNPEDGSIYSLSVSHAKVVALKTRSIGQVKEAAEIVPLVLQTPAAIFRGLRRDVDEPSTGVGALCYSGVPPFAYARSGERRAPWPDQVFLVFVSADRVVYNWYWDTADPTEPSLPVDHETRFQERAL